MYVRTPVRDGGSVCRAAPYVWHGGGRLKRCFFELVSRDGARPGRESPIGQGTRLPEMGTGRVSGGVGLSDHRLAGVIVRRRARGIGEGFLYRATLHVCTSTRRVHGSVRTRPDRQHVTLLGQEIRNITSSSAIMRNTAVSAPHHTQHCVRSSIASPRHEAATVRSSVEVFAQVWSDDLRMPSVSHGFISLTVRTYVPGP